MFRLLGALASGAMMLLRRWMRREAKREGAMEERARGNAEFIETIEENRQAEQDLDAMSGDRRDGLRERYRRPKDRE